MKECDIQSGLTYWSPRWKGARKVLSVECVKKQRVVHYVDLRTDRTGNSPLELFASNVTDCVQPEPDADQ